MQNRPTGRLLNLMDAAGCRAQHQYDDMVFAENMALFFRFDSENCDRVHLHFNVQCHQEMKKDMTEALMSMAPDEDLEIVPAADFEYLEPLTANEKIRVAFLE